MRFIIKILNLFPFSLCFRITFNSIFRYNDYLFIIILKDYIIFDLIFNYSSRFVILVFHFRTFIFVHSLNRF